MNKQLSKTYSSQVGFRPLLPLEPRIPDVSNQARLTEKFLLPELVEVEIFFLAVRSLVDPILQREQPVKLGKSYPLGQCLEITLAVKKLLQKKLDAAQLEPVAAQGYAAFSAFLAAGGTFRHAWGDLRGEYFQNAFQLGTLYVDVSNDTVTVTKPKVEILPFAQARFTAVTDFHHFERLAERYWRHTIVANHVVPELAPYCPFIHVNHEGRVVLREPSLYMIALVQAGQFVPSEDVLRADVMPTDIFNYVAHALAGTRLKLATSPAEGRTLALRRCREYRAKRWYASPTQTQKITAQVATANHHLAHTPFDPQLYTGTRALDIEVSNSIHPEHTPRYSAICKTRHTGKYWRRSRDNDFANMGTAIPLTTHEIFAAMMALPLGFAQEGSGFIPIAIRALTAGNNTFAIADSNWPGTSIPEVYRHYPFALATTSTGEQLLAIDEDGGVLSSSDDTAEPLFDIDGTLTPELQEVRALLSHADANREATARSCAALQQHRLIQPWPLTLQIGETRKNIRGLYRVDEPALNRIPAEVLKELQLNGALALAYCQLLSMQNFNLQKYQKTKK